MLVSESCNVVVTSLIFFILKTSMKDLFNFLSVRFFVDKRILFSSRMSWSFLLIFIRCFIFSFACVNLSSILFQFFLICSINLHAAELNDEIVILYNNVLSCSTSFDVLRISSLNEELIVICAVERSLIQSSSSFKQYILR